MITGDTTSLSASVHGLVFCIYVHPPYLPSNLSYLSTTSFHVPSRPSTFNHLTHAFLKPLPVILPQHMTVPLQPIPLQYSHSILSSSPVSPVPLQPITLQYSHSILSYSPVSLSSTHATSSDSFTPHIYLNIVISALGNANSLSIIAGKFHCHEAHSFLQFHYTLYPLI